MIESLIEDASVTTLMQDANDHYVARTLVKIDGERELTSEGSCNPW